MSIYLKALSTLSEGDRRFLERLAANLSLLADLSHADLLLYCPDGSEAVVVAEGCPEPVPSLYSGASWAGGSIERQHRRSSGSCSTVARVNISAGS